MHVFSLTVVEVIGICLAAVKNREQRRFDLPCLILTQDACSDESVAMCDAADKQVMKFSSGMHQRLGIARALLKKPSVLLLDEPSRSLDLATASQLRELIHELSAGGIAILLATHNFAEAAEVCDRVAVLQKGSLIATSRTCSLSDRQLREFYLTLMGEQNLIAWNEEVPA